MKRALSMMEPWIQNGEPFILVGPEGCGKDMIVRYAFSAEGVSRGAGRGGGASGAKRLKTSITVLHCNARTTAEHVITKVRALTWRIWPSFVGCACEDWHA